MIRKATDIFSEWASIGRDEGMQKNHWNAVKNMFQTLIKGQSKKTELRVLDPSE